MNDLEAVKGEVRLQAGKDRPARHRHPWVFSGAVARVEGDPKPGDFVHVRSADGKVLGCGMYASTASIRVRILVFGEETVGQELFAERLEAAVERRKGLFRGETNALRLVNAEGDDLPGLIVDSYAGHIVCQFLTRGMERRADWILDSLERLASPRGITVKQVREARVSEGLEFGTATLRGEAPLGPIEIRENGIPFLVDIFQGQKTGFYLDQRENRARIRSLAGGRRVLNCYAYTGSFTVAALSGGATRVLSVESSRTALALAREACLRAGFEVPEADLVSGDAVRTLKGLEKEFDLIILDPPAFAKNRGLAGKAARAYKEVNLQAMRRLAPGGLLLTCSCSRGMDRDLFLKVIFGAALDAGCELRRIGEFGHPADHPISVYHPEGEYLKAFLFVL